MKNLKFWQDKNENEIDLVIEENSQIFPVEIKFKQNLKSEDFRGIEAFLKSYRKIRKSYLINIGSQKISKRTVLLLPYSLDRII
jgi:predicted AAA+ superfamily ATPase